MQESARELLLLDLSIAGKGTDTSRSNADMSVPDDQLQHYSLSGCIYLSFT